MNDLKGGDLFDEKSLGEIFFITVRKFPYSAFNTFSTLAVAVILIWHASEFSNDRSALSAALRSMADIGVSFGSAILGFLIAGFTIFATLTKPSLLLHMYNTLHDKTKLNYLKYNFFAFVEVFAVYLLLIGVSILVVVLGSTEGAISTLVTAVLPTQADCIKDLILRTAYVVLGTLLYYALVALKSFIYNIYHAVMTSIVWELNSPSDDQ